MQTNLLLVAPVTPFDRHLARSLLRQMGAVVTVCSAYADVVLAWLATIVVGGLIYFFPLGQFLGSFAE